MKISDRIIRELYNVVSTVEDRIQNAILVAVNNMVTPRNQLPVKSVNASSRQNTAIAVARSERGELAGILTFSAHGSSRSNTLHENILNDDTSGYNPDDLSEFSVQSAEFDREPPPHDTQTLMNSNLEVFAEQSFCEM